MLYYVWFVGAYTETHYVPDVHVATKPPFSTLFLMGGKGGFPKI